MNKLILFFALLLPLEALALELKVGDILLQPLNCWSCSLIKAQEKTIYSHMGLVIETKPQVKVVEALGTVRTVTFESFRSRNQKGQRLSVRRFRHQKAVEYIQDNKEIFKEYFENSFSGLEYDHEFLWNNFDDKGFEKLYCSELISKMLSGFLRIEMPVKRMRFDVNREAWLRYFNGNPPDSQWGNSPGDFERSELFYEVGEL